MAQNILVVEDDRLNRELLSKVLRQEGYQVLEACDGDIALKILQPLPCDLVITDFLMPMLNGIEFVKQLRSLHPQMPIIFMTGYLTAISDKRIVDDVAEILAKPFEPNVLRSSVHRLLDSTPQASRS
jgi:two-component system, cell cycle sensor histidine kinase and response regulator CckA